MWEQKATALLRRVLEMPSVFGEAGLKSLSEGAGKIVKRVPEALGQFRSITSAAVGRLRPAAPLPVKASPNRFVPPQTYGGLRFPAAPILFGAAGIIALAVGLAEWLIEAARSFSIFGLVLAPILMVLLLALTTWLVREVRSWQRLAVVEQMQRELSSPCDTAADEAMFRGALARLLATATDPHLTKFAQGADFTADADLLRDALDRVGLQGMDANATAAIRAAARDVFFLSLLSTNAIVEVTVFTIRALGLARRVASAYGYRPGKLGLLRLARRIFTDIALLPVGMLIALEAGREAGSAVRNMTNQAQAAASAAHPLAGVAVGAIGHAVGAVAEGVTPRVAEATLAAGRIAQFGLLAAAIVRPVAFSESGYRQIRNGVYRQILSLRRDTIISSRKQERLATADEAATT